MKQRRSWSLERARAMRANPAPREWGVLAPSTPYPCPPGTGKHVGATVPGRGGGTITACATPAKASSGRRRRGGARAREGQYWLNGPGGWPLRKSLVRGRIRGAKHARVYSDPFTVGLAVQAAREFPCPTGAPFPHRAGSFVGDPEHPAWASYARAVERASAGAADEREVMRRLRAHPDYARWRAAADSAIATYDASMARRKATGSGVREATAKYRDAVARGEDTGSAEYLDTLARSTRRRRRRRAAS